MALFLEILSGELAGRLYHIEKGIKIGRNTGEIIIPDKKISSLHAQIEDHNGKFVLVDRSSVNGLIISHQRVSSIILTRGVKFTLGRTEFVVTEKTDEFLNQHKLLQKNSLVANKSTPDSNEVWLKTLIKEVPSLLMQNNQPQENLSFFEPLIVFDFIQGPEIDRQVVLGYGPRKFGSAVLDIEIQDKGCPPLAFEIIPEQTLAKIKNHDPSLVRLNGISFFEEILIHGSKISVGESVLEVSFISDEKTKLSKL